MIRLDNISKQNGERLLYVEASTALNRGERIGLVGPNGGGKTTLLKLVAGASEPDAGQPALRPENCFIRANTPYMRQTGKEISKKIHK